MMKAKTKFILVEIEVQLKNNELKAQATTALEPLGVVKSVTVQTAQPPTPMKERD